MILLDSDVMIDLFREYPPAKTWFDSIADSETMALSGFVVMELIQGCKNKLQLEKLQRDLAFYETVWLEPDDCKQALDVFAKFLLPRLKKYLHFDSIYTILKYGTNPFY